MRVKTQRASNALTIDCELVRPARTGSAELLSRRAKQPQVEAARPTLFFIACATAKTGAGHVNAVKACCLDILGNHLIKEGCHSSVS